MECILGSARSKKRQSANGREPEVREPTVADVMTTAPRVCSSDASLNEAAALLWEHAIGALPVVDGAGEGEVRGVLTDRDVAMAAYTQGRPLHEVRVATAMSGPACSCRPADSLRQALARMVEASVRRLVVVDGNNRALGVLSLSDIARHAGRPGHRLKKLERATCRALAAIHAPEEPEDTCEVPGKDPPDALSPPVV